MRSQVPTLGIIFMVFGVLSALFYLVMTLLNILGVAMGTMDQFDPFQTVPVSEAEALGQTVGTVLGVLWYVAWAVAGLAYVVAGWQIRVFRWRVFGIVTCIAGMVPCFCHHLCCTWVFGLGLGIWGLVLLFNVDVKLAFDEVAEGATPDEVLAGGGAQGWDQYP